MKRTMKLMLLLLCVASTAMAQRPEGTLSVVPRLGVNVSKLSGLEYNYPVEGGLFSTEKAKAVAGLTVGADVEYQLTDLFYLSAGLDYSIQRSKFDNCKAFDGEDADFQYFTGYSSNKVKTQYIHLPLMVGCYVYNTLSVKAGLQFGYGMSSKWSCDISALTVDKVTKEETATRPEGWSESMTSRMKRLEIGIPVGVAYEYEHVLLDLRYYHGLTKVFKEDNVKNRSLTLTVGYRFDIGKF